MFILLLGMSSLNCPDVKVMILKYYKVNISYVLREEMREENRSI
jgi:hypothetical protein